MRIWRRSVTHETSTVAALACPRGVPGTGSPLAAPGFCPCPNPASVSEGEGVMMQIPSTLDTRHYPRLRPVESKAGQLARHDEATGKDHRHETLEP